MIPIKDGHNEKCTFFLKSEDNSDTMNSIRKLCGVD